MGMDALKSKNAYYAHVRETESGEIIYQTVAEHLQGCARLCADYASAFGAEEAGKLAGLTHDLGKCTVAFQRRLLEQGSVVDHASAGAVVCAKRNQLFTAACVAGHHSGLPDFGNIATDQAGDSTLFGRLKKAIQGQYLENCGECGVTLPDALPQPPFQDNLRASYWTRMLYSCLTDGDFLDTEQFLRGDLGRGGQDDIPVLLQRLNAYIDRWRDPKTPLNRKRWEILNACIDSGTKPRGIYTLTVPTGGGKTVASLAFALHHAAAHGMQRVIYVIPYTSIIEQNAHVFRSILGDDNVLEHHSGTEAELDDSASKAQLLRALATENWDAPVIVTTAVQLFESIYANRSSRCRKLHNLANSVIIFDEAQLLPLHHLRPCTAAMASLAEQFHSTVVLCTATQPALSDLLQEYAPKVPITELCPVGADAQESFRRVTFRQLGECTDETLAELLAQHRQVLCVVNSRKAAQHIFSLLPQDKGSFHLSTLMISVQRQALLSEIRKRLANGMPCRVISTSLIEAGVDVDFPAVYRELAGLDSILQAAGRCNREDKRLPEESPVTIFQRTEMPPKLFRTAIGAAREALADNHSPDASETIARYFQSLRSFTGESLDRQGIISAFQQGIDGCALPFRQVAERFHFLDSNTHTVYVPYGDGAALVQQLRDGICTRNLYRKLSRYRVSVYDGHYLALAAAGALLTARDLPALDENSAILTDLSLYSDTLGLTLEPETGKAEFI